MDTIRIDKKNTKIVAHRGLSGIEPENTNASFIAAANRSYFGIETDIHRTLDGEFVVSHDNHLRRTAGIDVDTGSSTLAELQSIPLYDIDGVADRIDLRPPTLKNYLKICAKYEKHSVLELKDDFTDEEIAAILELTDEYGQTDRITYISFVYSNLKRIKEQRPEAKVEFLFYTLDEVDLDELIRDGMNIDINHKALTKEAIEMLHAKGFTVNCWTVNDKERGEELASYGIDYITTNILE